MDAQLIHAWSFPQHYAISGITNHSAPPACNPTARFRGLTKRQREVCIWAAAGISNRQIALRIGAAEATVKLHLKAAMRQLRVDSRSSLVGIVRPQGLVGKDVDLTPDEAAILRHIYAGKTMEETAALLGVEEHSVKSQTRALYRKLGVDGRVQAARWWLSRRVEG